MVKSKLIKFSPVVPPKINNLLEKKSEMELLISDLENKNKNLINENNNLINELNEYKKDKDIEKNCFQNNLNNIISNLENLNKQCKEKIICF